MSEIVSYYRQQAQANLSSIPWLASLQSEALKTLEHGGFPSRNHEEWKYTSVDALLKQSFIPATAHTTALQLQSDLPLVPQIVIHNGVLVESDEWKSQLPEGVLVLPLVQALQDHEHLVQSYLGQIAPQEHGFHALNTAFLHNGLLIYVPKNVRLEHPIVVSHVHDKPMEAMHLRHLIIADEHSEATIIEHYQGVEGCTYFTNTITEIALAAHAQLTHYKIQRESKGAYHLGHLAVKQASHSQFASHSLNLGAVLARSDISLFLQGEYAHGLMNGIYAPTEGQHVDHHTTVHHLVPNCSSAQDYKGILKGRARGVFNGKVIVAKDAQHTAAEQQNKNLLLSTNAEINTKPQLEIFADDVTCSHGATVGQLDEDALFYLASRGIDRVEASQYLIHAFAEDNIRLIPNRQLAQWISNLLTQQLG